MSSWLKLHSAQPLVARGLAQASYLCLFTDSSFFPFFFVSFPIYRTAVMLACGLLSFVHIHQYITVTDFANTENFKGGGEISHYSFY